MQHRVCVVQEGPMLPSFTATAAPAIGVSLFVFAVPAVCFSSRDCVPAAIYAIVRSTACVCFDPATPRPNLLLAEPMLIMSAVCSTHAAFALFLSRFNRHPIYCRYCFNPLGPGHTTFSLLHKDYHDYILVSLSARLTALPPSPFPFPYSTVIRHPTPPFSPAHYRRQNNHYHQIRCYQHHITRSRQSLLLRVPYSCSSSFISISPAHRPIHHFLFGLRMCHGWHFASPDHTLLSPGPFRYSYRILND
jgi:hypothetical protein